MLLHGHTKLYVQQLKKLQENSGLRTSTVRLKYSLQTSSKAFMAIPYVHFYLLIYLFHQELHLKEKFLTRDMVQSI